jgi:hypothetical protein
LRLPIVMGYFRSCRCSGSILRTSLYAEHVKKNRGLDQRWQTKLLQRSWGHWEGGSPLDKFSSELYCFNSMRSYQTRRQFWGPPSYLILSSENWVPAQWQGKASAQPAQPDSNPHLAVISREGRTLIVLSS